MRETTMLAQPLESEPMDQAYRAHQRQLWGVAYRLTGSASDADDVVQDAFARLARRAPLAGTPLKAWLIRVTVNLGLDLLRRRRRRDYPGIWLPSPVELEEGDAAESAGARYDQLESLSSAFLLALEVLSPRQRAVLILCDALDYSAQEAGEALDLSAAGVRMALTRARRAMAAYDRDRAPPTAATRAAAERALTAFLEHLRNGDGPALERLLAEQVRAQGDGGGEFASVPVATIGRAQVARFFLGLAARLAGAGPVRSTVRVLNGMPALVLHLAGARPPIAPVIVLQCDVDAAGRITELRSVMASAKLTGLRAAPAGRAPATGSSPARRSGAARR